MFGSRCLLPCVFLVASQAVGLNLAGSQPGPFGLNRVYRDYDSLVESKIRGKRYQMLLRVSPHVLVRRVRAIRVGHIQGSRLSECLHLCTCDM